MNARRLATLALATLLAACGSSTTSAPATMSVRLVDAPSPGYLEVNIDVQTVEINGSDGWIVLGRPSRVINLLALQGGVAETLVDGATLPAGHYGQMRLVLGPSNTVKLLEDGSVHPLKVPSGQQSGVKLPVNFDVRPGTTSDVFVDFDAHRSVFVHLAGASGQYILRPTVRAFDKTVTGSISGTLSNASGTLPAGVFVTAQTVGVAGPVIARTAVTDATGHYLLDLLPMKDSSDQAITYHVVSQPVVPDTAGTASYAAKASAGVILTQSAPTSTWNATFALASATGSATGTISPPATENQGDVVHARTLVPVGDGTTSATLIVRSEPVSVSGITEPYTLAFLPVTGASTSYDVAAERTTTDPVTTVDTTVLSSWSTVSVPAGDSVTVPNFAF